MRNFKPSGRSRVAKPNFSISTKAQEVVPAGTLVYSLKGWKAGYHRIWARREGGFDPPELTSFTSVEALREIAGWQVASLFLSRFRGAEITRDLLRQSGISQKKIEESGLDPYLLEAESVRADPVLEKRYEDARRQLRRVRFSDAVIRRLHDARGARVVIDLAARLQAADRTTVERVQKEVESSLSLARKKPVQLPRDYVVKVVDDLSDAYDAPGLETVLPEDIEQLRDEVTVVSQLPGRWSEAQAVLTDSSLVDDRPQVRVPRYGEFSPGSIVRIRSLSDPGRVEFNEVAPPTVNAIPITGNTASRP